MTVDDAPSTRVESEFKDGRETTALRGFPLDVALGANGTHDGASEIMQDSRLIKDLKAWGDNADHGEGPCDLKEEQVKAKEDEAFKGSQEGVKDSNCGFNSTEFLQILEESVEGQEQSTIPEHGLQAQGGINTLEPPFFSPRPHNPVPKCISPCNQALDRVKGAAGSAGREAGEYDETGMLEEDRCSYIGLSAQWKLLASKCLTDDPIATLHKFPPFEKYTAWLPTLDAAHRRQAVQSLADVFAALPLNSQLSAIIPRCMILIQVTCPEAVPDRMLAETVDHILAIGMRCSDARQMLISCTNSLRFVYPGHHLLQREKFVCIEPMKSKKRHNRRSH